MEDCLKNLKLNLNYRFSELLNTPLVKPYWIFISLSHKCNFNCQMCGVKKVLKGQELELALIKKILEEVSSWQSECTVLFTGGEPFLRKDIFEIIDYSVSRGLKTEIVSNGSMIDDSEMAERIVHSGIQNIAISLDGANPRSHDYIRQTEGAYQKAVNAIGRLCSEKKKIGSGPQISAWTTIMKENVFELSEVIFLVKALGVDCLVYHPVIVTQEDMQNTIKGGSLWITQDLIDILKGQIDKITDYQKKNGLVAFLHDPYLWLGYFRGILTKKDWRCNPFVFVDIGPDGFVRSCGAPFGNVKNMSLEECLNTGEAKNAREKMQRCLKPCLQTCWAKPEADSLERVAKGFILEVDSLGLGSGGKKKIIEKGLEMVSEYEKLKFGKFK